MPYGALLALSSVGLCETAYLTAVGGGASVRLLLLLLLLPLILFSPAALAPSVVKVGASSPSRLRPWPCPASAPNAAQTKLLNVAVACPLAGGCADVLNSEYAKFMGVVPLPCLGECSHCRFHNPWGC